MKKYHNLYSNDSQFRSEKDFYAKEQPDGNFIIEYKEYSSYSKSWHKGVFEDICGDALSFPNEDLAVTWIYARLGINNILK